MKTAAKIFIVIGMVVQFYMIYPLVVGYFALKKLDEAKTQQELATFAWLTLFLCNVIGGVLMLCLKDEDLQGNATRPNKRKDSTIPQIIVPPTETNVNTESSSGENSAIKSELDKAKQLYESGSITEEEYQKIRQSILSKYF